MYFFAILSEMTSNILRNILGPKLVIEALVAALPFLWNLTNARPRQAESFSLPELENSKNLGKSILTVSLVRLICAFYLRKYYVQLWVPYFLTIKQSSSTWGPWFIYLIGSFECFLITV